MVLGRTSALRAAAFHAAAGEWLPEHDALVADAGDDLQRAAERPNVSGERPDLGRAGLSALDGRNPLLPNVHAHGQLGLRQPDPLADLYHGVGTTAGHQRAG